MNLSLMFESHQERLDRLETVTWLQSERGGYERVVTRSITQQNIQRSQENASRNSQRAESFVPRMVKKFNTLDREIKSCRLLSSMADRALMLKDLRH